MKRMCTVVVVLLSFGMWGQGVLAGPVDSQGRPLIRKLGTIDCDLVEATPIVFKGKLYRSEWVRTSYKGYEMRVVRSQNLIHWNPSPLNPVLKASPEDKQIANPKLTAEQRQHIAEAEDINNSDIDFCPYKGRLFEDILRDTSD